MDKEQNVASTPDWSEYTIPELQGFISEIDSEIAHQIEGKKRELRVENRKNGERRGPHAQ